MGLALLAAVTWLDGADAAAWFRTTFRDTGYACLFAWVVWRGARGFEGRAGRILAARPLVYLGTISYGIYVFHHVIPAVLPAPPPYGLLRTLYVAAATLGVAALSFRFFEAPINGLKSRFPYGARAARRREPAGAAVCRA
ncbi:MAG: acyltransferase family protein, partial [Planctomycetota bacterium]